jgi:hypothetical protein
MKKYKLVNPYLQGGIVTSVDAKNENSAAEKIWEGLSKNIVNVVPSFAFTIKDIKSNKLYNYSISESQKGGSDDVEFTIKPIKIKEDSVKKLNRSISNFEELINDKSKLSNTSEQKGGDKDDKDDKDEKERKKLKKIYKKAKMQNYINNIQTPIYYWWYNPLVYDVDYVYIPTFTYPLTPYVQLDFGTTLWY